jgi:hypothetical protein
VVEDAGHRRCVSISDSAERGACCIPREGNDYRAIVAFDFQRRAAFIKFVGTHTECDKIDALTVDRYSRD